MHVDWTQIWLLVVAACVLTGWWLSVRPGASYRGISASMSCLIVLMTLLMCILALEGQRSPGRPAPAAAAAFEH